MIRSSFRRASVAAAAAAALALALAAPVAAHGDHDARPIARNVPAGPYTLSVWQVYPDAGDAMLPVLIVMFDGLGALPPDVQVEVLVDGEPAMLHPSMTTANGVETMTGVEVWSVVSIAVAEGGVTWRLDTLVVPPPPTAVLPMRELIYLSIVLSAGTAAWAAWRAARGWRQPALRPS